MASTTPWCSLTTVTTSAAGDAQLGNEVTIDGNTYRWVQATAAITSAPTCALAYDTDLKTTVVTSTTANDPMRAGVVPSGLTYISATANKLDAGDCFWMQISGSATAKKVNTVEITDGAPLGLSTGAGSVASGSVTYEGYMGVCFSGAATGTTSIVIQLRGLR